MGIKQKDLKLLWGKAANRCSICRTKLAYDSSSTSNTFPIGEQAHIVAEENSGPRGESILTSEQRNSYPNLILLCPTCHTKIDKAPSDYPIEELHRYKTEHELWVDECLTNYDSEDPSQLIYSHLIDEVVVLANLVEWNRWASNAVSSNSQWPRDISSRLFVLQQRMQLAIWPGTLLELELSMQVFVKFIAAAFNLFREHSERCGDYLTVDYFYRIRSYDPAKYHRLLNQFDAWEKAWNELVREATKAANWFADVVHQDINSTFFLTDGRFALVEGMFSDMSYRSILYEYDAETKPTSIEQVDEVIERMIEPYVKLKNLK
ncbi:hypothetical protein H6G89_03700 [Oscillatoria sp. FACHB-1407]|uniref:HNH endonuclease n=1 Tax=Oscillatoria sp. FACHB-1407 TaxID=2692847 RepID=UPI00168481C3|nr:HNH endonuclease [Oscillatoria sp. FACHB-1407]MBD2460143.1 hypothetical protein [Oscillatoria sp. FACHB-1407]